MKNNSDKRAFRNVLLFFLLLMWAFMTSCAEKLPEPPAFPMGADYEDYMYLKDRINKNPDNVETYLYLGESCIMLGKLDEAEECFDRVLKANPTPPPFLISEAHRRLSHLYLNHYRYDACMDETRIIRKTYPWERETYDLYGHYWFCMKENKRALFSYMGEFVNSTCTDCYVGVGNLFRASGDNHKAEIIYMAGKAFDRECPFVKACLANLLASQMRYDEAEAILLRVLSRDPEMGEFYVYMGNLQQNKGALWSAVQWYEKSLETDGRSAEYAYAGLAETYLKLAEREDKISNRLIALVFFELLLIILIVFLLIRRVKKGSASEEEKRKSLLKTLAVLLVILVMLGTLELFLLRGKNIAAGIFNPQYYNYLASKECLEKAVRINPYRKDLRLNFAKTFRGIGLNRDAEAEEAIAALLPEYDIYRSLRFSYP